MQPTGSEFSLTEFVQVRSAEQVAQARELFREYLAWLEINLCFQNFEKEVAELPGEYVPPGGRLLLVYHNGALAGCIALRKLGERVCEMKRLFLRPQFRGQGLGRSVVISIIHEAKQIGYQRMRLDTLPPKMNTAIALYESLGFKRIDPYYENPVPGATFMELDLVSEART
jgi:putative acetyltransferase